jgi:hypothetical protein
MRSLSSLVGSLGVASRKRKRVSSRREENAMNVPTRPQIIEHEGRPLFVVLPHAEYLALTSRPLTMTLRSPGRPPRSPAGKKSA